MVTETVAEQVETPADQAPAQEEQTEDAPQLTLEIEDVAADPEPEAAVEDKPLTRAEVEALIREREESVRRETEAQTRERERRERQRSEARRAREQEQRTAARAELRDTVSVSLAKLGVIEPDQQSVEDLINRVAGKDQAHVRTATLNDVADAFSAAAAQAIGFDYDGELSPSAESYVENFAPFIDQILQHERVVGRIVEQERKKWEAELPKKVDAEIARRNAESRKDKTNLQRPDGTPTPTRDDSDEARVNRIIANEADEADRAWWQSRFGKKE